MHFDLLIKGGEVVDPGANLQGRLDVAIQGNRIAAVEPNLPAESAAQVIDASGQYVTPGLIDLHTHIYHGVTYWGIQADPVAARSGVTTWLDVGSAGGYNLIGLRDFIVKPAASRIYALLNISSIGLTAATGELANLSYCDVDLCCKMADLNRDLVLGIKVRIDVNTTGGGSLEALHRARMAAERCELPMMVHIGKGPPSVSEVLALMRPGDILTHCFTGQSMRLLDDNGQIREEAKRAWEMGIVMDVGHGGGSFSFESAEALINAGYRPDVISTDIHQTSILGPLFDMPTCMSKFLAMGMSFSDIIRATTTRPATVLGLDREIGTLRPGALADVALFRIEKGNFPLYDIHMVRRDGKELITNTRTIINGRELPRLPDPPSAPWMERGESQQALVDAGHTPEAMLQRVHAAHQHG